MKVLIAEDDQVSRRVVEALLLRWGYETISAVDGYEAKSVLESPEAPPIALLDWMMPGLDGVELCRLVRARPTQDPLYLILLTARGDSGDIVEGLQAGANDYITKPFEKDELRARVAVGHRVVELQQSLSKRVHELEEALSLVRQLEGLLPICCYCKRIRDDGNYWQAVENYLSSRLDVAFSHGICPTCYEQHVRPEIDRLAG
jgi:sigma-B regulation protein RsbU (phosphoserine phosphatase)